MAKEETSHYNTMSHCFHKSSAADALEIFSMSERVKEDICSSSVQYRNLSSSVIVRIQIFTGTKKKVHYYF